MFAQLAEKSRGVADAAMDKMVRAHQATETERQRADVERQRADTERQRADRLAAKFRELGIDPEA